MKGAFTLGLPVYHQGRCYNASAFISSGRIHGVIAKSLLPSYQEFYETRWFTSGLRLGAKTHLEKCYQNSPISNQFIFRAQDKRLAIGIEICEDLWAPQPLSGILCQAGLL